MRMEHATASDLPASLRTMGAAYRFIGPGNFDGSGDASANTPGISIGGDLGGGSSGSGPAVGPASPLVAFVGLAGVGLMIAGGLTGNLALFPVGLLIFFLALPLSLWERRQKGRRRTPRPQAQAEPAAGVSVPAPLVRPKKSWADRRRDAGMARLQRRHPGLRSMTIKEIWEMLDFWSSTSRGSHRLRIESRAAKQDVTITRHGAARDAPTASASAAATPSPMDAAAPPSSAAASSLPAARVPVGAAAARAQSVMSQARTDLDRATDEGTSGAARVGFDTPAAREYPPAPGPLAASGMEPAGARTPSASQTGLRRSPEGSGVTPAPGARTEDPGARPDASPQHASVVMTPVLAEHQAVSRPQTATLTTREDYVLELYDDTIEEARLDAKQPELADASIVEQILVGAIEGDAVDDPTRWAIAGQVVSGFIPIWGQIADGRDVLIGIGAVWHSGMKDGKAQLGLSLIALVPGVGDYLKACVKPIAGNAAELAKVAHVAQKEASVAKHAKKVTVTAAGQEPKVVKAVEKSLDAFVATLRREVELSNKILDPGTLREFEALLVKYRKATVDQLKPTAMDPFAKGYRWEVARFMQVLRDPQVTRITAIGRKVGVDVRKSGKVVGAELEIDLEFIRGGFRTIEELKNTKKLGDDRLLAQLDKIRSYMDLMAARGITVVAAVRGTVPQSIGKKFTKKAGSLGIGIEVSR
jgi:hypothetical protein